MYYTYYMYKNFMVLLKEQGCLMCTRRNDTSTYRALSDQSWDAIRDVAWHMGNTVYPLANFFESKILINDNV